MSFNSRGSFKELTLEYSAAKVCSLLRLDYLILPQRIGGLKIAGIDTVIGLVR
jgi:hypothetical protein